MDNIEQVQQENEWTEEIREEQYTFQRPTLADNIKIGKLASNILGEDMLTADNLTKELSYILATLKVVLIKAPEGFNIDECRDMILVGEINKAYLDKMGFFRPSGEDTDPESEGEGRSPDVSGVVSEVLQDTA